MAHPGAHFARLRVVQTGHGMDRPDGCGEFCNKYRELWFDGVKKDTRQIWKQCGNNPLYPQAGTWVYDRAGWCPGDLVQPDLYDLPVQQGKEHVIDINMQSYTAINPSADEVISAYLVQYKKAASVDVRINEIVTPSQKDIFARLNPAAFNPTIVVQNVGSVAVKSLRIKYGANGMTPRTHTWTGLLAPGATQTLTLPGTISGIQGTNRFEVELLAANGKKDAYNADNKLSSTFTAVPQHDSIVVVYLLANDQPLHNSYTLTHSDGTKVAERPVGSLVAGKLYRDTVKLAPGFYRFALIDTADNGLEFWANARGGRGKVRLLNGAGAMLRDFESDFGSAVQYDFEVSAQPDSIAEQYSFGLYPTRTQDKTTFDYYANFSKDVVVQLVTDPGDQVVETHSYNGLKEGVFTYDLSRFPKGRFYLKVLVNGVEHYKKRIRLKE